MHIFMLSSTSCPKVFTTVSHSRRKGREIGVFIGDGSVRRDDWRTIAQRFLQKFRSTCVYRHKSGLKE